MSRAPILRSCTALLVTSSALALWGAGATPAAAQATAGIQGGGWPRNFEKAGDQVALYQPQVDEWTDYSRISFRAALGVTASGKKEPVYGVLAVKGNTFVNHDDRTVLITDLDTDVRFVNIPEEEAGKLQRMVRDALPNKSSMDVSLDLVLACMNASQAKVPTVNVYLDPPPIYRSESPAILVIFMGPPQFKPVKDTRLMCAINTNWDVFLDLGSSQYFLLNGSAWLTAPDPMNGPWTAAPSLPPEFSKLPADANWEDVRKHIPGQTASVVPKVFRSNVPAELILTEGAPAYTPLTGVGLLYVSNPPMPLFMDEADGSYYYLVAGRWFRAKSVDGPWSAASRDLPAKFAKIPADSPVGYALASVPQTQEAKDAILLASVPHTATIKRSEAKLVVEYDGDPKFADIPGTSMKYATNSPDEVISAEGQYYCCDKGVWFVAPAPTGTWTVCGSVPSVIYTIPSTSPLYNVTYVRIYSTTPETVVCGYTAGYSGAYVAATGALMFGAGMLVGAAIADSHYLYCPAYFSYGCAACYHYGYGGFYRGCGYYGPYGGAGHYAGYNAATGTFSRGAYRYGPYGAADVHSSYNPFTNTYRAHAGATNGYQSWGRSVATRGDEWAASGHVSGAAGSAGWVQTSTGRSAEAAHGAGGGTAVRTANNTYAAKDGNVYRKPEGGEWQHYGEGGWHPASEHSSWSNSEYRQRMNSEFESRSWGNELDSRCSQFRGGGFGGFRGGGFRGGFRR